jgi:alkylation response protein AidB-like acyl-CoA dehydrogenase
VGCRLDGSVEFVLDADLAERLLVAVETEDGERVLALADRSDESVTVEELTGLDLTRRLSTVRFDGTRSTTLATGDEAAAAWVSGDDLGALLACADSVGCSDRLVELTVEYALQRVAFGKTIAHYQAVKHKCADMLYWLESSRVALHHAARQTDGSALSLAVGRAKSLAGEACSRLAGESLQVHGGIGFTWEHDLHLYLRRIKTNEVLFGDPAWHRHRIAPELN